MRKRNDINPAAGIRVCSRAPIRCAEFGCVWNAVHWENGEQYANGCFKFSVPIGELSKICAERDGKQSIEEAARLHLI